LDQKEATWTAAEVLRIHKEVFYGALKSQNYAALEELYSDDYISRAA
jgi:hypothetical protein